MSITPQTDKEVLHASCGPVRGNVYQHDDKTVDGYLGIPYAKPPVGELRFKKPEPADPWTDIKDCTKYGPKCLQTDAFEMLIKGGADEIDEAKGLSLNVFAPRWKSTEFPESRPVMVYLHGSGYEVCSSADYVELSISSQLPLKDVILVTANYRLNFVGYLSTGDPECVENLGLWDQTLALKWVQKHIRSFGGNPDNVTLFGCSAGGSSTDLLALSPHSRDLFHKMCSLSGAAFCDFAIRTQENQKTIALEFATHHGYTRDSETLFSWFKRQPANVLCKLSTYKRTISGFLPIAPTLDGVFFPKPLDELRKEAPKKAMIFGLGEYEALAYPKMIDPPFTTSEAAMKKFTDKMFGDDIFGEEVKEEMHKKIYDFYMGDVAQGDEDAKLKKVVEFLGDTIFNTGALESVRSSAKYGNDTYFYSFEYVNEDSLEKMGPVIPFKAASHGTDLAYILGHMKVFAFDFNEADLQMVEKMTTIFTNFAKYGNPGWPKYTIDKPETHYRISLPEAEMRDVFQNGRCTSKLWQEIQSKHKSYQKVVYGKDV